MSRTEMGVTMKPFLRIRVSQWSCIRRVQASRTGVRLVPQRSARSASERNSPGGSLARDQPIPQDAVDALYFSQLVGLGAGWLRQLQVTGRLYRYCPQIIYRPIRCAKSPVARVCHHI